MSKNGETVRKTDTRRDMKNEIQKGEREERIETKLAKEIETDRKKETIRRYVYECDALYDNSWLLSPQ